MVAGTVTDVRGFGGNGLSDTGTTRQCPWFHGKWLTCQLSSNCRSTNHQGWLILLGLLTLGPESSHLPRPLFWASWCLSFNPDLAVTLVRHEVEKTTICSVLCSKVTRFNVGCMNTLSLNRTFGFPHLFVLMYPRNDSAQILRYQ